jgi:signal transduction histidine kinase/HAMP domain-containing protein
MRFSLPILRHPRWRSLGAKLIVPLAGLMMASLLLSTFAFVIGTRRTQDQLLRQQVSADLERVRQALEARSDVVKTTANLLAQDSTVIEALPLKDDRALPTLNNRAVVVRDRFQLDLVQIYNRAGIARANLVASSLYRVSSLFDATGNASLTVRTVEGKLLLLGRATLPENGGTIITGLDLEAELSRTLAAEHLPADLSLGDGSIQIGTRPDMLKNAPDGQTGDQYAGHESISLAGMPLTLYVVRRITDITEVTNAGLLVMIVSACATTVLLIGVGVAVTRSITQPLHQLSLAAEMLAKGNLSQQVEVASQAQPFAVGAQDELGVLGQAFNTMVTELRALYQDLESKVEARTQQLATASEVARAASASLDLDVTLRTSVDLICERFNFYHAAIFIIDPRTERAVLREARGETGRILKGSQYELAIGSRSLVGTATATRQPQIVQDVAGEPRHLRNPLLNPTQSEAVMPLLSGDTLVGALDVQSMHVNAFTPDLVTLLKTLADQLAVAIRHAQLYAQQLDAATRLAELDRLKTQFLTNMSHELRTPLNAIIGFSKVLLKGFDGPITDMQRTDLTAIHTNSQHLLGLINNVLDYSKIEAGEMELIYQSQVDLKLMIQTALSTAAGLIKGKPIGLDAEVPRDLLLIEADGTRVQQILINLISNAAKFTSAGHINLRARVVHGLGPRSEQIEPFVEISVADTGIGIAARDIPKLFEPFSQVDGSSTRQMGGAGLGLIITRQLVELHAGRISVESQPGKGSTFTFILPVHAPHRHAETPVKSTSADHRLQTEASPAVAAPTPPDTWGLRPEPALL